MIVLIKRLIFYNIQVATLLLLSQQEERHLHERNMNEALLKKVEELQKNLSQVICLLFCFQK